jgi:hypothetical protein
MRLVLASLPQMLVMAAIVDTALFVPFGAILAFLSFLLFGVSLQGFITFGGALNAFVGLIAWWGLLFLPSIVYAAFAMPWSPQDA